MFMRHFIVHQISLLSQIATAVVSHGSRVARKGLCCAKHKAFLPSEIARIVIREFRRLLESGDMNIGFSGNP